MAWQYVGSTSGAGTSNGYTVSLTSLTGGIASAPAAGDLVVVFSGFGNTASSAPAVSGNASGAYLGATAAQHVNDTWDAEFGSFYQVQGATPDTSLTITRTTNTAYGGATTVQVWRGVDTASPFIGAATPASGGNGAALNPPAYDPAVASALVIAGGAGTMPAAGTAGYTAITGLSNIVTGYGNGSTADTSVIMGSVEYAGSAIDPAVATGGTQNNTSSSWAGVTIAFRQALQPVTGSGGAAETGTDTASASGSVFDPPINGSGAATESGQDAASATGSVADSAITGAGAATSTGTDAAASSGSVLVQGAGAASDQGADAAQGAGDVVVQGSAALLESGQDAADGIGGSSPLAMGAGAAQENAADVAAGFGVVLTPGEAAPVVPLEDRLNAGTGGSPSTQIPLSVWLSRSQPPRALRPRKRREQEMTLLG